MLAAAAALAPPAAAHAAGGFGPPQTLGGGAPDSGVVTVDAFGNAFTAWRQGDALLAATRPTAGSFGPPMPVGGGVREDAHPALAITPRGELVIAWTDAAQRVHARWGVLGGTLGPDQVVGTGIFPQLAADGHGTVLLSWKGGYSDEPTPVYVAERPLGGRFGEPQAFGSSWGPAPLAANLAGHAAVLWQPRDGSVWLAARSATGRWSEPERVPFQFATLMALGVDVDDAGTVFVPASPFAGGTSYRVWLRRRAPDGSYAPEETLDGEGTITRFVVQPTGDAVFLVSRQQGEDQELFARVRTATGAVTEAESLGHRTYPGGLVDGPHGGVLATLVRVGVRGASGPLQVTERLGPAPFDPPTTLAEQEDLVGGVPALGASGAAAVGWYARSRDWTVAVRDAPAGLGAAAHAHAQVLGPTLAPVVSVPPVPALPVGAPAVTLPVKCSELCDVVAGVRVPGRAVGAARVRRLRLVPGHRTKVRVRLSRAQRRALRGGRLRFVVRARGYSRRTATRRGAVRVRRG